MSNKVVTLITTPSLPVARKIGLALVKEHLAACVNIVPKVESIFFWEGKTCREHEALMIVKTTLRRFEKMAKRVRQMHPYSVPEIIALPIRKGFTDYLDWIEEMTR